MIKAAAAALACLAFACKGAATPAPPAAGCPPASGVALAQWSGGNAYQGTPEEPAWLVRLGFRPGDYEHEDALHPAPGPVPSYEISKLGLGPLPDQVWLFRPGAAPCPAKVASYVSERVDDGPISARISAVLTGCPAPAADETYPQAWISFAGGEPTGCELRVPVRTGQRTGVFDDDNTYSVAPLTAETELPAAWQSVAPDTDCGDGCAVLWAVDTVDSDPSISSVTITHLTLGPDACALEFTDRHGIYATAKDAAPTPLPLSPELALDGVLVDTRGPRVVLASGIDRWEVLDLDGATAPARSVQFFLRNEEDILWHSMAPYCGP
jgi:hypothetical protein